MSGYALLQSFTLSRYPVLVWKEEVILEKSPPHKGLKDLFRKSFSAPLKGYYNYSRYNFLYFNYQTVSCLAGLFRGIGVYGIYEFLHILSKNALLSVVGHYVLPPMDPRDDPDYLGVDQHNNNKMTGRTQFVYKHTGLDSIGQYRYMNDNILLFPLQ